MPSLKQVQDAIKYIRAKNMKHQSTVEATEEELRQRVPRLGIVDDDAPFVFGVPFIDGLRKVGDGGIEAFGAGK
ncbi:unnamed protein product [Aphanomyces euteiches]